MLMVKKNKTKEKQTNNTELKHSVFPLMMGLQVPPRTANDIHRKRINYKRLKRPFMTENQIKELNREIRKQIVKNGLYERYIQLGYAKRKRMFEKHLNKFHPVGEGLYRPNSKGNFNRKYTTEGVKKAENSVQKAPAIGAKRSKLMALFTKKP